MLGESYAVHGWFKPESFEEWLYWISIMEKAQNKSIMVVLSTAMEKPSLPFCWRLKEYAKARFSLTAPTEPLVQQHYETFIEETLFEEGELILVTGSSPPEKRKGLYTAERIVFATSQCVLNDLKNNRLTSEDVSLSFRLGYRSRRNHAYVGIASLYFRQRRQPLVFGLTPLPKGSRRKSPAFKILGAEAIEH